MATSNRSQFYQTAEAVLIVCAALVFGYYSAHPQRAWLIDFALLAALCVLIGFWVLKLPLGILINERNLMSLSRFQLVCWSIAIFSGYIVIAMQRVLHHVPDPLNVAIDNNLWAVLGISTASFVGAPLLLNGKTDNEPSPGAVRSASLALNEGAAGIQQNAVGTLYSNPALQDARFADMFEGDEIGNTAYVDVSKVQMFVLTVLLIGVYCLDLWHMLAGYDKSVSGLNFNHLDHLPAVSASMLQLLAVSHAGYLTFKAVGHTQTT